MVGSSVVLACALHEQVVHGGALIRRGYVLSRDSAHEVVRKYDDFATNAEKRPGWCERAALINPRLQHTHHTHAQHSTAYMRWMVCNIMCALDTQRLMNHGRQPYRFPPVMPHEDVMVRPCRASPLPPSRPCPEHAAVVPVCACAPTSIWAPIADHWRPSIKFPRWDALGHQLDCTLTSSDRLYSAHAGCPVVEGIHQVANGQPW